MSLTSLLNNPGLDDKQGIFFYGFIMVNYLISLVQARWA